MLLGLIAARLVVWMHDNVKCLNIVVKIQLALIVAAVQVVTEAHGTTQRLAIAERLLGSFTLFQNIFKSLKQK